MKDNFSGPDDEPRKVRPRRLGQVSDKIVLGNFIPRPEPE